LVDGEIEVSAEFGVEVAIIFPAEEIAEAGDGGAKVHGVTLFFCEGWGRASFVEDSAEEVKSKPAPVKAKGAAPKRKTQDGGVTLREALGKKPPLQVELGNCADMGRSPSRLRINSAAPLRGEE